MGGFRERDMPCMGLSVPFAYHLALRCKSCKQKKNGGNLTFIKSFDKTKFMLNEEMSDSA